MKSKVKKPATGLKRVARTLAYPVEFRLRIVKLFLGDGLGTSYIPSVKPILLVHDYEELRISRIFGNTPPACSQIFSSADSLA
jgi:hypothetical protein